MNPTTASISALINGIQARANDTYQSATHAAGNHTTRRNHALTNAAQAAQDSYRTVCDIARTARTLTEDHTPEAERKAHDLLRHAQDAERALWEAYENICHTQGLPY